MVERRNVLRKESQLKETKLVNDMKVGTYVRQALFSLRHDDVYRYGVVVDLDVPEPVKIVAPSVKVMWSPNAKHPVASAPYPEYVSIKKLEVVCG